MHIPNIAHLVQHLEDSINHQFIPALTGRDNISEVQRDLFALPTRLGGLGIAKPTRAADVAFAASEKVNEYSYRCMCNKETFVNVLFSQVMC